MDKFGWVPATAGNISVRFRDGAERPGRIAITRSGVHKGFLDEASVIEVDFSGRPLTPGTKPSAETLLHCQILSTFQDVGAVVHGHSVAGTVLSMVERGPAIYFEGYELFKAFAGQTTHEARLPLPLFANDQDMARLAGAIAPHLGNAPLGYYIRGHGIYVWGPDMDAALARLEAIEFLLECELRRRQLASS
jgi:methylthioribulose-1-phosphate dehydratase